MLPGHYFMDFTVTILGLPFLVGSEAPSEYYKGTYSLGLVLSSYGFAFLGSFAGLVMSQQITFARKAWIKATWIATGAVAMGGGVWSMHFIGMIAYSLPFDVAYDRQITYLSILPAIVASGIALYVISRRSTSLPGLLTGGVLMGAGVGAMHYIGMAAMRAPTSMGYDPWLFALSIVTAIGLACLALSTKFHLEALQFRPMSKYSNLISGAIMGLAIAGMHYIAMAAAKFYPGDLCMAPGPVIAGNLLLTLVNLCTFVVIVLAILAAVAKKVLLNASLLETIFKNSVEGIVIADGKGTITLFSPAAEQIFGYRADEILGQNVSRLMSAEIAPRHRRFMAQYDSQSTRVIMAANREVPALRKDGTEFPIEITVSDISPGHSRLFSATIRDITERKRAEQLLRRAHDELEASLKKQILLNKMQGEFVSMIAHDFRMPLTIIDMTAQRLASKKGGDGIHDERAAERAQKIRDAVQRMTKQMESMLSAATKNAGEFRIEPGRCEIRDLVHQICRRFQDNAPDHRIALNVSHLPDAIIADRAAVDQILTNLLSNAIKFSPNKPDIEVRGWQDQDKVYIAVADEGIGIDKDALPELFDKSFRAGKALGIAGSGVGLSLSQRLAEKHGGTITAESEPGVGSTFTLCLPVYAEDRLELPGSAAA